MFVNHGSVVVTMTMSLESRLVHKGIERSTVRCIPRSCATVTAAALQMLVVVPRRP